jgi:hypothetical protein
VSAAREKAFLKITGLLLALGLEVTLEPLSSPQASQAKLVAGPHDR